MATFATTLLLTFIVIVAAILWLSYCKRHQRHGKHALTGMCHERGGAVCSSCASIAADLSERGCNVKGNVGAVSPIATNGVGGNGGPDRGGGKM